MKDFVSNIFNGQVRIMALENFKVQEVYEQAETNLVNIYGATYLNGIGIRL